MSGLFDRVTPLAFDQFLSPNEYDGVREEHERNQSIMERVYIIIFIIYVIIGLSALTVYVKSILLSLYELDINKNFI